MLQNIKFNFILRHVPLNWLKHSLARTLTIIHTKANPDWQFKFVRRLFFLLLLLLESLTFQTKCLSFIIFDIA